jgi:hyperosmotically inducible protein
LSGIKPLLRRAGVVFGGEQSAGRGSRKLGIGPRHAVHPSLTTNHWRSTMTIRHTIGAGLSALLLLTASGCAVTRGQETVGAYVDDATITTQIKSRFIENKDVDAASIRVETLNGTVMLSGFAKNALERSTAESIARKVNGVKSVKNEIAVRP